jgi:hypothetical protein
MENNRSKDGKAAVGRSQSKGRPDGGAYDKEEVFKFMKGKSVEMPGIKIRKNAIVKSRYRKVGIRSRIQKVWV